MASSLIVPVVEVKNVREHPQADMLSISEVLGYQMVNGLIEDPNGSIKRTFVRDQRDAKGKRVPATPETPEDQRETVSYSFRYKEGSHAVYFPADTILTDEWAEKFEVKHLLREGNRVGRARLRGEVSFGLVVEIPEGQNWTLGQNVADYYGAKKWEPDPNKATALDAAAYDSDVDPHFVEYTDLEDGFLLYEKLRPGEEVVAVEKIHGNNCRVGLINGTIQVGSRTNRKDPEKLRKESIYWPVAENEDVLGLLKGLTRDFQAKIVILFGEIFGAGVQSLNYGQKKTKGFRAFDIYVDGRYLSYDDFEGSCDRYGVQFAPLVYRGPFSLSKIKEISNGKTTMPGADHVREGVVVRPAVERRDPALGRVVLKFVGSDYNLSSHKDKDTKDL